MHTRTPSNRHNRPRPQPADTQQPARLLLLHKPFQVLSQFSAHEGKQTLADVLYSGQRGADKQFSGLYPAGRLDFDSEGLLILTNHGPWQARIAHPRFKLPKTYWAQVEGVVTDEALLALRTGVMLNDGPAMALQATRLDAPVVSERVPPIRHRAAIPTSWIALVLGEGRNRQVRRMTAAVGLPTLRLIRVAIGPWQLNDLAVGACREIPTADARAVLG